MLLDPNAGNSCASACLVRLNHIYPFISPHLIPLQLQMDLKNTPQHAAHVARAVPLHHTVPLRVGIISSFFRFFGALF
jgi:hypothetical protein